MHEYSFLRESCASRAVATSRNTLLANQEISRILWNPKVHYHVHDNRPFLRILSPINSVQPTPSHLISLRSYIHTYLLTPRSTVLLEKLTGYQLVNNSPHKMEPESSHPRLQEPAPVPILSLINPVHAVPLHFLKTHFNIILPSMPGSSKWFFPSGLPTRTLYAPLLSLVCATYPANLILLDLITRIIFGEEYRSLSYLLRSFLHSPVIFSLLGPNILPITLFSNTLNLRSSLNVRDQVYRTTQNKTQNCIST